MKVGLFAPDSSAQFGGVWQYSQWVVAQLDAHVPLHLVLPDANVAELLETARGRLNATVTSVSALKAKLEAGLAYRLLEAAGRGRLAGRDFPFYRRVTGRLHRQFLPQSFEVSAYLAELRRAHVDLLHIPMQSLSVAGLGRHVRYVINPHDYQHEHFPQFFTAHEIAYRRAVCYADQRAAAAIVVHSLQTRDDAIRHLGVPEERVFYAPYGRLATFPDVTEDRAHAIKLRLGLPDRFIFYPARMWEHKNHAAILDALHELKTRRGLSIACVFTDDTGPFGEAIAARTVALGLGDQVSVVGRVTPEEMGALYRLSSLVIVPSLFEQNSGPMLEALHFGKAIAVSNIRELVHSLGEGGLVFDPLSTTEIADVIDRVMCSPATQADLEARAQTRAGQLDWTPFVETYKRAYAFAAAA